MKNQSLRIYTIGHSNIEMDRFIGLLHFHGIALLADVRSEPFARYADWFNRNSLERALAREEIRYEYFGKELGGRPEDPDVYDAGGELDYEVLRKTEYFRNGINTLLKLAGEVRTAIMCSEEDPLHCHRSLLIAPALGGRGVEVVHIRHDGEIIGEHELRPQMKLPLY